MSCGERGKSFPCSWSQSKNGGWLIEACRIKGVFAFFFFFPPGEEVVIEFFSSLSIDHSHFFLHWHAGTPLPPVTPFYRLSMCYCTCGYWTNEGTNSLGDFKGRGFGLCGRCWGNRADGEVKCSLGWSPWEVVFLLSASVSAAVLNTSLMLQVVITVLTNSHWWRDLQPFDLWLEATAPVKQHQTQKKIFTER